MLPRDVWHMVIRRLGVKSTIRLRGVSHNFKLLIDTTYNFSRLCLLAHLQPKAKSRPDTSVDHGPPGPPPAAPIIRECSAVSEYPTICKIPEGALIHYGERIIFIPWIGVSGEVKPPKSRESARWNRDGYYISAHADIDGKPADIIPNIDHLKNIKTPKGASLALHMTLIPDGYYTKNVQFTIWRFNPEKRVLQTIGEQKIRLDVRYLEDLHVFHRTSGDILKNFIEWAPKILDSKRDLRFVGNHYIVRGYDIHRIAADGTETFICTSDEPVKDKDGVSPWHIMFEFGRFFCMMFSGRFVIYDDKIVLDVETKKKIEMIYHDDSIIAFDTTVIILRGDSLEVFEHEMLRGVMCIGERVVFYDGSSVFFV